MRELSGPILGRGAHVVLGDEIIPYVHRVPREDLRPPGSCSFSALCHIRKIDPAALDRCGGRIDLPNSPIHETVVTVKTLTGSKIVTLELQRASGCFESMGCS